MKVFENLLIILMIIATVFLQGNENVEVVSNADESFTIKFGCLLIKLWTIILSR